MAVFSAVRKKDKKAMLELIKLMHEDGYYEKLMTKMQSREIPEVHKKIIKYIRRNDARGLYVFLSYMRYSKMLSSHIKGKSAGVRR
jgi:hypothetical protein